MTGPYNPMTRRQFIDHYMSSLMSISASTVERRAAASELSNYKKQRGMSWTSLGITEAQQSLIAELLHEEPAVKLSKRVSALSARFRPTEPEAPKLSANDNIRQARDQEVARLLGLGTTTTEIYRLTGVPRRTVDRIRDKLIA